MELIDFGSARNLAENTIQANEALSYNYASPEHFDGLSRCREAADQFVFGILCSVLLTGAFPFGNVPRGSFAMAKDVLLRGNRDTVESRLLSCGVPAALARFIAHRLLAVSPEARGRGTLPEFLDLLGFGGGRASRAGLWVASVRHSRWILASLAGVVALAVAAIVFLSGDRTKETSPSPDSIVEPEGGTNIGNFPGFEKRGDNKSPIPSSEETPSGVNRNETVASPAEGDGRGNQKDARVSLDNVQEPSSKIPSDSASKVVAVIQNSSPYTIRWGDVQILPNGDWTNLMETLMEKLPSDQDIKVKDDNCNQYHCSLTSPVTTNLNPGASNDYTIVVTANSKPTLVLKNTGNVPFFAEGMEVVPEKEVSIELSSAEWAIEISAATNNADFQKYWNAYDWPATNISGNLKYGETTTNNVMLAHREKETAILPATNISFRVDLWGTNTVLESNSWKEKTWTGRPQEGKDFPIPWTVAMNGVMMKAGTTNELFWKEPGTNVTVKPRTKSLLVYNESPIPIQVGLSTNDMKIINPKRNSPLLYESEKNKKLRVYYWPALSNRWAWSMWNCSVDSPLPQDVDVEEGEGKVPLSLVPNKEALQDLLARLIQVYGAQLFKVKTQTAISGWYASHTTCLKQLKGCGLRTQDLALDRTTKWKYMSVAKPGDEVKAGDTLGTVPERIFTLGTVPERIFTNRVMVPSRLHDEKYTVVETVTNGTYGVGTEIAKLKDAQGKLIPVSMVTEWPNLVDLRKSLESWKEDAGKDPKRAREAQDIQDALGVIGENSDWDKFMGI